MRSSPPLPSPARRRWLSRAAALALAAAARARAAARLELGAPAPPLVLHTLDGRLIATRDLLGSVVVPVFWASWCDACRGELPLLSEYAARHARAGLVVLGFSLDAADALPEVRKIAARLSFPVGLLGSAWAGDYGRIWRLPVSFVIDRDGKLRYNGWHSDQAAWTARRLERSVSPWLRR
jgi:peroxiredoxin